MSQVGRRGPKASSGSRHDTSGKVMRSPGLHVRERNNFSHELELRRNRASVYFASILRRWNRFYMYRCILLFLKKIHSSNFDLSLINSFFPLEASRGCRRNDLVVFSFLASICMTTGINLSIFAVWKLLSHIDKARSRKYLEPRGYPRISYQQKGSMLKLLLQIRT